MAIFVTLERITLWTPLSARVLKLGIHVYVYMLSDTDRYKTQNALYAYMHTYLPCKLEVEFHCSIGGYQVLRIQSFFNDPLYLCVRQ